MSVFASLLRGAYKLSGAKRAFGLPEEEIRKVIEKQNRHRGVFTPTDKKAYYEMITVNGFPCLIVREKPQPSKRAILYFFGGGMVIGPDRGDLPVMRKLMRDTGCDIWFPFYPLCVEHCITETYDIVLWLLLTSCSSLLLWYILPPARPHGINQYSFLVYLLDLRNRVTVTFWTSLLLVNSSACFALVSSFCSSGYDFAIASSLPRFTA